ncbi:MAG: hypothetical protein JXR63_00235 [Spirochaetales bacterium]|nr:hypothetical protein [Spirochaetales bacterium]
MKDIEKKLAAYKSATTKDSAKPYTKAELMHDIYIKNLRKSESSEGKNNLSSEVKAEAKPNPDFRHVDNSANSSNNSSQVNSGSFKSGFSHNIQRFSSQGKASSEKTTQGVELQISNKKVNNSNNQNSINSNSSADRANHNASGFKKIKTKEETFSKEKERRESARSNPETRSTLTHSQKLPENREKESNLVAFFKKPRFEKISTTESPQSSSESLELLNATQESNSFTKRLEPEINIDKIAEDATLSGENSILLKTAVSGDGYKKIAKFLMLLGKDESAKILRQFNDDEIEIIARHMSQIKKIESVEADSLFKEFNFLKERAQNPSGGINVASNILINALGKEKADFFIKKISAKNQEAFGFLNDIEASQLYLLLKKESPQVLSIILSFLDKKLVSEFLKMLSREKSIEIIKHLAVVKKPSSEIIISIEDSLKQKLRKLGNVETDSFEGSSALAGILRYMDLDEEEDILSQLDKDDPILAAEIREKLITIDLILGVDDIEFQDFLKNFTIQELATLVKGQSREITDKIYNNVSSQRRGDIEAERQYLGAMHSRDVNKVVKEFLARLKQAQVEGKLYIYPAEKLL